MTLSTMLIPNIVKFGNTSIVNYHDVEYISGCGRRSWSCWANWRLVLGINKKTFVGAHAVVQLATRATIANPKCFRCWLFNFRIMWSEHHAVARQRTALESRLVTPLQASLKSYVLRRRRWGVVSVNINSSMAGVTIFVVIFCIVSCFKNVIELDLHDFGADQRSNEKSKERHQRSIFFGKKRRRTVQLASMAFAFCSPAGSLNDAVLLS